MQENVETNREIRKNINVMTVKNIFNCPHQFHRDAKKILRVPNELCYMCKWPIDIRQVFLNESVLGKMLRKWLSVAVRDESKSFLVDSLYLLTVPEDAWINIEATIGPPMGSSKVRNLNEFCICIIGYDSDINC